jgi:hypothetical protein
MLAKVTVHHFHGSKLSFQAPLMFCIKGYSWSNGILCFSTDNVDLGTACGKYFRVCCLSIIDPGKIFSFHLDSNNDNLEVLFRSSHYVLCVWFRWFWYHQDHRWSLRSSASPSPDLSSIFSSVVDLAALLLFSLSLMGALFWIEALFLPLITPEWCSRACSCLLMNPQNLCYYTIIAYPECRIQNSHNTFGTRPDDFPTLVPSFSIIY